MIRLTLGPDEAGLERITTTAAVTDTPFYLYDTVVLGQRVQALRSALPDSDLYYSAKANPHPNMLTTAADEGCGIEIASIGELGALIAARIDPRRSILVGPAKTDRLLKAAVECGVSAVVIESERELRRLITVVAEGDHQIRVMLRLNLPGARGALRMSGHQFGMTKTDIISCHELLAKRDRLTFVGYHGYLASQLLDVSDIVHNACLVLTAVDELDRLGYPATHVDLGGGFGVAYNQDDLALDLAALEVAFLKLRHTANAPRLAFESGRFLAGPSGALVCRVIDVKTIGDQRFILLDGGMNMSGLFGGSNSMRGLYHSVVRGGMALHGGVPANICGPLCTPMDRLATNVAYPADVDDLVVWWNMGAYGLTAAPVNFLSFPHAAEVIA